jgi:outer membrane immunogenic protein
MQFVSPEELLMPRYAHKVVLGAALAFCAVTASVAADLPVRGPVYAPPPPVAIYSWTGFYIGINAGYGWGELDNAAVGTPIGVFPGNSFSVRSDPAGFVGGVQIGYNWQTGTFVWGLEADFQGTTLDETVVRGPLLVLGLPVAGSNSRVTTELDWFGTIRGRLGVTFMPELLAYITGGFAYGDVSVSSRTTYVPGLPAAIFTGAASSTETGWTVGGGLEYGFGNWSAKVEYLYVSLSAPSYVALPGVATPFRLRHSVGDLDLNVVRFGLNYRF